MTETEQAWLVTMLCAGRTPFLFFRSTWAPAPNSRSTTFNDFIIFIIKKSENLLNPFEICPFFILSFTNTANRNR